MKIRGKLLVAFMLAFAATVTVFSVAVTRYARRQFDRESAQRSEAVISQFRHELAQRGEEVARSVEVIAEAESSVRMALDLTRAQADPSVYAGDATVWLRCIAWTLWKS